MNLIIGIVIGIAIGISLTIFFIGRFYFIPVTDAQYISKYGNKVVTVMALYDNSVSYELDGKVYNVPRLDFCRAFKELDVR